METTGKFDKEHIMRWLNPLVSWDSLCENFEWDEEILEKCQNRVNWTNIARNRRVKWNAQMIDKFKERIDWNTFSWEGPVEVYTAEHLEKFKEYWNWYLLSRNRNFELSKELLDASADYWDWDYLLKWGRYPGGYPFKYQLARKSKKLFYTLGMLDIKCIADLEKAKDLYDVCMWDIPFLEKYKEYIDWHKISCNPNMDWTSGMIRQFKDYIDWDAFSSQKTYRLYTVKKLEKYKDYWNWTLLSGNGYLEWNEGLLKRFADWWDWSKIVDNWGVVFRLGIQANCFYTFDFVEKFVARYQKYIPEETLKVSLMGEILRREGDWAFIFTKPYLEKYEHQMTPSFFDILTLENKVEWDYDLLDRHVDDWNWQRLINNDGMAPLFSVDFVVRYQEYIPWDKLEGSFLRKKVVEELCEAKGKNMVDLLLTNERCINGEEHGNEERV